MNLLLTCAGRRNYLVRYFQQALGGRGQVIAADLNPDAAALQEADLAITLPPLSAPHYLPALIRICREYKVGLLVPLNDLELPLLATARLALAEIGTHVVVSEPGVIQTCFDKWATHAFLQRHGLPRPQTLNSLTEAERAITEGRLHFPLVVKPRWGSASIAVEFVRDAKELFLAYHWVECRVSQSILAEPSTATPGQAILIQEQILGDEYGLDVVNDLAGRHVTTWARRKLAMRAGETDRAITVIDPRLTELGEHLGRALGHVGNLDCDVILADGIPHVIELNPRFGGGYPFSQMAGANLPALLLAWAQGEATAPEWLQIRSGIASSKCDRLVEGPILTDRSGEGRYDP